jgi:hypothetical protein
VRLDYPEPDPVATALLLTRRDDAWHLEERAAVTV